MRGLVFINSILSNIGLGERTKTFLKGLQWSFIAALISKILTGITFLLVARKLGPAEYGEASLSLSASLWLQIPFFLGIHTALVHYFAVSPDDKKENLINIGFSITLALLVASLTIESLFSAPLAARLGLDRKLFILALLYCGFTWPYNLLKTLLNAKQEFKSRASLEIAYSVLFPLFTFVFIFWGFRNSAYILGLAAPCLLLGAFGLIKLRPKFSLFSFSDPQTKNLLVYGALASTGGLAAALFETPARLIVNKNLGLQDVGILSAYQSGSSQLISFISAAVTQVFFPIASRTPNKKSLFVKMFKTGAILLPLLSLALFITICLYIVVLGKAYPFRWTLCLIFSLGATLSFAHGMLAWFIASFGWRGVLFTGIVGILIGGLNILSCLWAIPRYNIMGAGVVYIFINALGVICFCIPNIHTWLEKNKDIHDKTF